MKAAFTLLCFACCQSAIGQTTCYHLPKSSAAYYSCESVKQQEQFNRDQKRENDARQRQAIDEANRNTELQSYQYQQRDRQRASDEMAALLLNGERAEKALKNGNCDEAQNKLDEAAIVSIVSSANSFPSAKANDAIVELQLQIIEKCVDKAKKETTKIEFLKKMESRPGELATKKLNIIFHEKKKSIALKNAANQKPLELGQLVLELASTEDMFGNIQWLDNKRFAGYAKVSLITSGKVISKIYEISKLNLKNNIVEYDIQPANPSDYHLHWEDFKQSLDRAGLATQLLCKIDKSEKSSYFRIDLPSEKTLVVNESIGLPGSSGMGSEPYVSIIISPNTPSCGSRTGDSDECCLP